jgi:dTDP-4-dehydrorhamnose 3,5-epimerase-like enzyme
MRHPWPLKATVNIFSASSNEGTAMPFIITPTAIPEVLTLDPQWYGDERGFFFESYNLREFQRAIGLELDFVQDNHSHSRQGVPQGLCSMWRSTCAAARRISGNG